MGPGILTRDRKVRMTLTAIGSLYLGLITTLLCSVFAKDTSSVGLLVGVYAPYAAGVGAALGLFISGNVKVHTAQAAAGSPPNSAS